MSVYRRRDRGTWTARVTGSDGKRHSRSFSLKADAERWEREEIRKAERGEAPTHTKRDSQTVAVIGEVWIQSLSSRGLKPKTLDGYQRLWNKLVCPHWGARKPRTIHPAAIRDWVMSMSGDAGEILSKSRRQQASQVLAMVLDEAVVLGLIASNPARDMMVSRAFRNTSMDSETEHRYLTAMELRNLAATSGDYGDFVYLLGVCGLRFGEVVALTVGDLQGNRLNVSKSISEVNGEQLLVPTKTGKSRSVPVPSIALSRLDDRITGRTADQPLFTTPSGTPIRYSNFRNRVWLPAVESAALGGLRIHDLRHTAASLAVAAGANVKAVQEMLGHASAAMTLDRYSGLFSDHLDEVADRLDDLLADDGCHQNATTDFGHSPLRSTG